MMMAGNDVNYSRLSYFMEKLNQCCEHDIATLPGCQIYRVEMCHARDCVDLVSIWQGRCGHFTAGLHVHEHQYMSTTFNWVAGNEHM